MRDKHLNVSAINIVTHPHSPDTYVRLLRAVFRSKARIKIYGSDYLMIGTLRQYTADDPHVLYGQLYRFVHLDSSQPWVNTETNDFATEEDMSGVNLPEELLPGSAMFNFVFFAKSHKLFFEKDANQKSISPLQVQRYFERVLSFRRIKNEFGDVDVTVVPDQGSLTRILRMHQLRQLTIDVKKPNPDNMNDISGRVMGRLDRLKARRETIVLTAEKGQSLELTDDIIDKARVAAQNGKVMGNGRDENNRKLEESTAQHPWEKRHTYNEGQQTALQALMEVSEQNQFDD